MHMDLEMIFSDREMYTKPFPIKVTETLAGLRYFRVLLQ